MNLLVDSQTLYWWMAEDQRLPQPRRERFLAGDDSVWVSAASIWELEIKRAAGKLTLDGDVAAEVMAAGFWPLDITFEHGVVAAQLPLHHRDPFDRMLVAQARVEGLTLVSVDRRLARYDVPILWD